jgi:CheY-like chemotaxis protein
MRILLADDDEDIRELSSHLLGRHGWVVSTVSNGEEALEALATEEFDLVVLDQSMPPGSGLEVAAARRDAGDLIPIVLWTGWGGLIDRAEVDRLDVQVVNKAEVSGLAAVIASLAGDE